MAQTWWPRSSDYATCSTTREADSTAVTDLRDIDILSRAPQPCARFISTIISSLSASSNPPLLTDYTKGSRPTTTSRRVGSLFPYACPGFRFFVCGVLGNFRRTRLVLSRSIHLRFCSGHAPPSARPKYRSSPLSHLGRSPPAARPAGRLVPWPVFKYLLD